ncbi:hypothetical protein Ac2012v2_005450 [Leucoagaricus gongylophorus]
MPIEDGTYLIHSSGEDIRNFYPVAEYDGQQIATISGASNQSPTEVQRHPDSDTYTITAKETRGTWTRITNRYGDDIVIHTSNPSGWSHHWKFIEVNTRTNDPLVGIASFESPPGGNLYVDLDSSDRATQARMDAG